MVNNTSFNPPDTSFLETSANEGTLFFLSFDLVNSTEYKNRFAQGWVNKITEFYSGCINGVSKQLAENSWREWKKNGDEVLFYFKIESDFDLYKTIPKIAQILKEIISMVQKGDGAGILSVKATIWSAFVTTKKEYVDNSNLAIIDKNTENMDFIGPDIDFGFRIAKENAPGIICIDPKILAMFEDIPATVGFHVVDFVQVKGVWNGRYVPVVWYHEDIKTPQKIFEFDESKRNHLVKTLFETVLNSTQVSMKQVIKDVNIKTKLDKISNNLQKFEIPGYKDNSNIRNVAIDRISETHIVAILFNKELNKVFCALRANVKPNFPNQWEFGCTQLIAGNLTVTEQLKQAYKDEFNLNITSFFGDTEHPYVVDNYKFIDSTTKRWIPGFRYTGIAEGDPSFNPAKHSKSEWILLSDIDTIAPVTAVPNFHDGIKKAHQLLSKSVIS
ncbi:hypothetical protein [Seleniivibrio woodruffii]|uniref:Uncharacterized protein n=1 Tax=Seleniivibrio woodruffii TaxID=1078050 RepID=A0A4V2PRR3_9BACT|nr:hypothetical protein [Seleniivibrio woodruffii]TCK59841.1 hypothetical protein C8D98_2008 [Seleniivibrio woodruffii]TVZ35938.1 hypothetical protein OF66_1558 [Seleniivibrio woodruffii]